MRVASRIALSRSSLSGLGAISALAIAALVGVASEAPAKIPGAKHCYNGICHRIMTLPETEKAVGTRTTAKTSFYDDCSVDRFNTCALTSSGEVFKPHRPDNAASPIYPDGTKLLLWNPKTKVAAVIRVNSAGPYHSNRTLDVSRATAEKLGFKNTGVATLHIQILEAPTPAETRYKKRREYAPVPGPIGVFSDFEMASFNASKLVPRAWAKLFANDVPPLARSPRSAPVVMAGVSPQLKAPEPLAILKAPEPPAPIRSQAAATEHQPAAKPLFSGLMMSRAPMSSARVQPVSGGASSPSKVAMNSVAEGIVNIAGKPSRPIAVSRKSQQFSAAVMMRRNTGSGS